MGYQSGDVLLSHAVARAVPSGLRGLTAVFGMGTGVSPSLWSPETCERFSGRDLNIDGRRLFLLRRGTASCKEQILWSSRTGY